MRILIFGAGVLGGNLAGNLFKSGKDVTLLARGEWGRGIRENGLVIRRKYTFRTTVSRLPVIEELKPDDWFDVIFVVMRYTQLDAVMDGLKANRSKNIVLIGNNVRAKEYAARLAPKNVMFGFALSAGHREKDRIVSIDLKKITIGQLKEAPSNEALIHRIFEGTGYRVVYEANMEDYLLCHAAFVIPVAFACYYTNGDLRKLVRNREYLGRVLQANIEGYRAIEKAGHAILPKSDRDYESESYRKLCLRLFRLMCATSLGKLCASDHAMSARDEMGALADDLEQFFEAGNASCDTWKALREGS